MYEVLSLIFKDWRRYEKDENTIGLCKKISFLRMVIRYMRNQISFVR